MKLLLSIFLVLFIVSGCSSKKRVVAPIKVLPTWYTSPSMSNAHTLYAVGEGEDKNIAVANALSNMAATLSVSIESDFNTKSVVRDGVIQSVQTDSINQVNSKVKKLRISNYQIINSKEYGFQRYLVSIKSDKRKLFSSLLKEIDEKIDSIQIKYKESEKFNSIKQLNVLKVAKETTATMRNTLLVMNLLNPSFDDRQYLSQLLNIENRYDTLLSKITFSIDANEDARKLMPVIANGLSLEKYNIVKKTNGKNHFQIRLVSSTSRASSYGFDLARSAISITVKDNTKTVIGSNKLNVTGQSTQGYAIAKENIALKLNAQVLETGIENIIGLEL